MTQKAMGQVRPEVLFIEESFQLNKRFVGQVPLSFRKETEALNAKKLDEYNLTGSIHTVAIKSPGTVDDISKELPDGVIKPCRPRNSKNGIHTTSIVNANKLVGDLFTYDGFKTAFDTIIGCTDITDYEIIRTDMRFDSYDIDHYEKFAKLNRYLLSLQATLYNIKNRYITRDLYSEKQLSVAVKNGHIEIEAYDKNRESNGRDPAMSRLEERSVNMKGGDIQTEFLEIWFDRWDKALSDSNIAAVHRNYNEALVKQYNDGKNAFPVQFRSVNEFLVQHRNQIFCRKQMVDLLREIDPEHDPEQKADNFKRRFGIEYFQKSDLKRAVGEIKRATKAFFDN